MWDNERIKKKLKNELEELDRKTINLNLWLKYFGKNQMKNTWVSFYSLFFLVN